jgi:hypothetical protein
MPYQAGEYDGAAARAMAAAALPFGLQLSAAIVAQTERIVWYASRFTDPGPDWNEFQVFDAHGQLLATVRKEGY